MQTVVNCPSSLRVISVFETKLWPQLGSLVHEVETLQEWSVSVSSLSFRSSFTGPRGESIMLRRLPRCLLWRHIGCLQTASIHAERGASNAARILASAAGQQHAHVTQQHPYAGGSNSSGKWQTWPAVLGLAAAAWHAQHSTALADAHRPDKVQAVPPASLLGVSALFGSVIGDGSCNFMY
jgi:hypothetical protein